MSLRTSRKAVADHVGRKVRRRSETLTGMKSDPMGTGALQSNLTGIHSKLIGMDLECLKSQAKRCL